MEDNLVLFLNGWRPQIFDDINFVEMEYKLFSLEMEDKLKRILMGDDLNFLLTEDWMKKVVNGGQPWLRNGFIFNKPRCTSRVMRIAHTHFFTKFSTDHLTDQSDP